MQDISNEINPIRISVMGDARSLNQRLAIVLPSNATSARRKGPEQSIVKLKEVLKTKSEILHNLSINYSLLVSMIAQETMAHPNPPKPPPIKTEMTKQEG